jgi:hypothetical protein
VSAQAGLLAQAVESAIFQCLMNAQAGPENEELCRKQADKLESKFTTQHGRHYSYFINRQKESP